jgi:uncharacterized protein YjbI with pentapeptide repeats
MNLTTDFIEDKIKEGSHSWNQWTKSLIKEMPSIKMYSDKPLKNSVTQQISLKIAEIPEIKFKDMVLDNFDFSRLKWTHLESKNVIFKNCNFYKSDMKNSELNHCTFDNCNFEKANLINSNFNFSKLTDCIFKGSNLSKSEQFSTIYNNCSILDTSIMWSKLIETTFIESRIFNSKIFGAAIWNVKILNSETKNLIITKNDEPEIKIDNIEVAQFIYLILNNQKIRDVITTLTSKIVLILGRFTDERLKILESIKEVLILEGFVPVLFTFEKSPKRDLTETIQLLANISKLVIADVSDSKSIPQELSHIIPSTPSLPIQPIIVAEQKEYSMFEHWNRYEWVRPIFEYRNEAHIRTEICKLVN